MKTAFIFILSVFLSTGVYAQTDAPFPLGGFGGDPVANAIHPGSPGFLPITGVTNNVTNMFLQSQTFTVTPWALLSAVVAAPTLTANAATAPDSTNTATQMTLPAVTGTNARSTVYQTVTTQAAQPYTASIYVKGAVGGEKIWLAVSEGTYFYRTAITATTSWQRVSVTWVAQATTDYLEVGVDLKDSSQNATPAQTVYIWGAQMVKAPYLGDYIVTTTAQVTQSQTRALPTGIAFRDFSTLTAYSGNPVTSPTAGSTYNSAGVSDPRINTNSHIGTTFYAPSACINTPPSTSSTAWDYFCLWEGTDPLHWTDPGSPTNPIVTNAAGTWKDNYMLHPSVAKNCSLGTYCMYYSARTSTNVFQIGMSYSNDFLTWTDYASNPVITNSTSPNLEVRYVGLPSVIKVGSTFHLFAAENCVTACGYFLADFTSTDGVTFALDGPVFGPFGSGDWNFGNALYDPEIILNKHGFYEMFYTTGSGTQKIGYAISKDLKDWYNYQTAPVITQSSTAYPGTCQVGDPTAYELSGTFYLLYDTNCGPSYGYAATMADY